MKKIITMVCQQFQAKVFPLKWALHSEPMIHSSATNCMLNDVVSWWQHDVHVIHKIEMSIWIFLCDVGDVMSWRKNNHYLQYIKKPYVIWILVRNISNIFHIYRNKGLQNIILKIFKCGKIVMEIPNLGKNLQNWGINLKTPFKFSKIMFTVTEHGCNWFKFYFIIQRAAQCWMEYS